MTPVAKPFRCETIRWQGIVMMILVITVVDSANGVAQMKWNPIGPHTMSLPLAISWAPK